MDDLCKFCNLSVCPYVKEIIENLNTKLSQEGTSLMKNFKITNNFQHNWLVVVAGRKDSEQKSPSTIRTYNLTRVFIYKKAYGTTDKKKLWNKQKRNNVILMDDSHARDCTSILQDKGSVYDNTICQTTCKYRKPDKHG